MKGDISSWIAFGLILWMCFLFVLNKLLTTHKKKKRTRQAHQAHPKQREVFLTAEQTQEVIGRLRSQLEAGTNTWWKTPTRFWCALRQRGLDGYFADVLKITDKAVLNQISIAQGGHISLQPPRAGKPVC